MVTVSSVTIPSCAIPVWRIRLRLQRLKRQYAPWFTPVAPAGSPAVEVPEPQTDTLQVPGQGTSGGNIERKAHTPIAELSEYEGASFDGGSS